MEPIGKLRESVVHRKAASGWKVQAQVQLCIDSHSNKVFSQKATTSADVLVILVINIHGNQVAVFFDGPTRFAGLESLCVQEQIY